MTARRLGRWFYALWNERGLHMSEEKNGSTGQCVQQRGASAAAIVSIIFAIIAFITALIPIINNLAFVAALVAAVCGIVGIIGTGPQKKSGRGLAVAGLVIAIVSLVAVLVSQSIYGAAIDAVNDELSNGDVSSEQTSEVSDSASADTASEQSAYSVKIGKAAFGRDYTDAKVIIVTYTFTNNDGDKSSAAVKCNFEAYQDGAELETAIGSDWDSDGYMQDVKKGGEQKFQLAYVLNGDSDVEVEVSAWLASDTVIASKTFAVK